MLTSIAPEKVVVQALFLTVAMLIGWGTFKIGVQNLLHLATPLYLAGVTLLLLTAIVGVELRGSRRWLGVGPARMQTSELVKPMILLFATSFFIRPWPRRRIDQARRMGLFVALLAPLVWLILLQPDLGTAIVIMGFVASVAFFSGLPRWLSVLTLAVAVAAIPFSQFFLKDYQVRRIDVFLHPLTDPRGAGYSMIQSVISIGSGQFVGRGLGHGTQSQLQFLPERQTDFIFSSLVEELGFVGGGVVILLYGFMIAALMRAATMARDRSSAVLLGSCATWLFFQSAVNTAMSLGLVPVVGITLPLLSYGGSSLASSAMMLGLAVSAIEYGRVFRYHRGL